MLKEHPETGALFVWLVINGVDLLGDGFIIAGNRMAVHVPAGERLR